MNKKISTPIVISAILILIVLVGGFTYWQYWRMQKDVEKNIKDMEAIATESLCIARGGEWHSCLGAFGPCGCTKVFNDGGKSCTKASDCSAKACIITDLSVKIDTAGSYEGNCPKDSFELKCAAFIEKGKVIKDDRCVY